MPPGCIGLVDPHQQTDKSNEHWLCRLKNALLSSRSMGNFPNDRELNSTLLQSRSGRRIISSLTQQGFDVTESGIQTPDQSRQGLNQEAPFSCRRASSQARICPAFKGADPY